MAVLMSAAREGRRQTETGQEGSFFPLAIALPAWPSPLGLHAFTRWGTRLRGFPCARRYRARGNEATLPLRLPPSPRSLNPWRRVGATNGPPSNVRDCRAVMIS